MPSLREALDISPQYHPEDLRFVECPCCEGRGAVVTGERHWPGNWYEPPEWEEILEGCSECWGTGCVLAEVEPIEMEDLPA